MKRPFVLRIAEFGLAATLAGSRLWAQTLEAPTAYSITQINFMFSQAPQTVYRNGSMAMIDHGAPASPASPKGAHIRTYYDLQAHTTYTVDMNDASVPCGGGRFSGDWGDPFAFSGGMMAEMGKGHVKEAGVETVNGVTTKILESVVPGSGTAKAWVDGKSGLVMKLMVTPPTGPAQLLVEVKSLSLAAPAASLMALPEACGKITIAPTDAERLAAVTGGNAGDFSNAIMGPGTADSCTVLFRVVRAGSMEPVTRGFQVAVDPSVDVDHPASYSTGISAAGHATFSGGGLRELTAQMQNGVVRIDNPSKQFRVDAFFGNGGDSSALIYRRCAGPQTVLLYVVKNPGQLSDGGDWLWVKSGKFATVGR